MTNELTTKFIYSNDFNTMDKVPIELTPYDALQILTFLTEMKEDMHHPEFASLKKSIDNYGIEIYTKIRNDQIDDAVAERAVNVLLGKEPHVKR